MVANGTAESTRSALVHVFTAPSTSNLSRIFVTVARAGGGVRK
jgi:hypothetical protein